MTAPSQLLRAGWKSNSVKPGDKVSVVVRPLKSGDPGGLFVSVTLPDGRVPTERAPAGTPAGVPQNPTQSMAARPAAQKAATAAVSTSIV
jgi:hypothetical protein